MALTSEDEWLKEWYLRTFCSDAIGKSSLHCAKVISRCIESCMQSYTWKKICSTWVKEEWQAQRHFTPQHMPTGMIRTGEVRQQERTRDQLKLHPLPWPVNSPNHQLALELGGRNCGMSSGYLVPLSVHCFLSEAVPFFSSSLLGVGGLSFSWSG